MSPHTAASALPPFLPPCPRCGGRFLFPNGIPGRATPKLEELSDDAGGGWRVSCYGCHSVTEGYAATPTEAIRLWLSGQVIPYA